MPIAIREDMLSGDSLLEKFTHARALGAAGVEFASAGLTENVPEIIEAIEQTGVQAAAVNFGHGRFVDPDPAERELALEGLRRAIVDAHDIGAAGVSWAQADGSGSARAMAAARVALRMRGTPRLEWRGV